MSSTITRLARAGLLPAMVSTWLMATAPAAGSAILSYAASLSGPAQLPPNPSPATGWAEVDVDDLAHTLHVRVNFSGLLGTTTAAHIHAPTPVPLDGTAAVATTTPTFVGFPLGVTSGWYDATLDLALASSYNPFFIAAHEGTTAGAEAALLASIAGGEAYFNIHSSAFGGGEIRGFLVPFDPTPARAGTWGAIKTLYR